jgi:hypothetical protein
MLSSVIKRISLLCVAAVLLTSCTVGARMLPSTRYSYNLSLSQSKNEEVLLNLVRMRYGDSPFFFEVSNITSSLSLSAGTGASASFNKNFGNAASGSQSLSYGLSPSFSYSESPTVVYSPLTGSKLTKELLSPISLEQLYLLLRSDWSLARVLRVTTQALGPLENAHGATRPGVSKAPAYKDFNDIAHALRKYQKHELISESIKKYKKTKYLQLFIKPGISREIARKLNLPVGTHIIRLFPSDINKVPRGFVQIKLRSLMGIMYYLSKAVDAPVRDYKNNILDITLDSQGRFFDWHKVTRGMMDIKFSYSSPRNAMVKIFFRGKWFYIDDSDVDSKETLVMLSQIFSLQAEQATAASPGINITV